VKLKEISLILTLIEYLIDGKLDVDILVLSFLESSDLAKHYYYWHVPMNGIRTMN